LSRRSGVSELHNAVIVADDPEYCGALVLKDDNPRAKFMFAYHPYLFGLERACFVLFLFKLFLGH
jgi:hypothetical protein